MKKMLMAAVVAILVMLGGSVAFAQDDIDNDKSFFDLGAPDLADISAGWGSQFAEEEETFSQDAQYATVQADILGIDLFDATSGLGAQFAFGGELEYTVWSLNRATIPGTGERVYAGSDLKLIQSADDGGAEGDFDVRIVTGYRLAEVGPGQLRFELYFIEEDSPIGFALLYGF